MHRLCGQPTGEEDCWKRRDLKLGAKFEGISGVQHNVLEGVTNFKECMGSFGTCSSVACIAANI